MRSFNRSTLYYHIRKHGNMRGSDGSFQGVNGRPEYVRACCDASPKRLGVDHIGLHYQHRVDHMVPIEDTVGAMNRLVEAGKVHRQRRSGARTPSIPSRRCKRNTRCGAAIPRTNYR